MNKFLSLLAPRKITALPSYTTGKNFDASNYTIARNKRNIAIATCKDETKLYVAGGTSPSFLDSTNYDSGIFVDLAMNAGGVVVEVHKAQYWDTLYCTVGSIAADGAITLGSAGKYDSGVLPSVAVNAGNVVVEVHQSEADTTLWYHTGRVSNGAVSFGTSVKYDDGINPQIAINGNGVVVAVHLTSNAVTNTLYYHVGIANPDNGTIDFGSSVSYDSGRCPHVAITDDNYVIEVHKSQSKKTLWYRLGQIDVAQRSIAWLTPDAVHFTDGTDPAVSISDGRVSIIYHHDGSVYVIDGLLVSPSWMVDEFRGSALKLNEIAFPGSHDAAMYEAKSCTLGGGSCNTVTQSKTLHDQLAHGSRYFDLRPVILGGQLELGHYSYISNIGPDLGFQGCSGEKLGPALAQVAQFANESSDVIILKFSHYINLDSGVAGFDATEFQQLVDEVRTALSQYMYHDRQNTNLGSTPIQNLLGQGQATVLCVFDGISPSEALRAKGVYAYKDFGRTARADLVVYDKYSDTNELNTMVSKQITRLLDPANRNANSLFLLSWTLTQSDLQAATCTKLTGTSILDLAKVANSALYERLVPRIADGSITRQLVPNVVYVDACDAQALNMCYLLNTYLQ